MSNSMTNVFQANFYYFGAAFMYQTAFVEECLLYDIANG